jgi:predicted RNA-binding protein with PUA-like domain
MHGERAIHRPLALGLFMNHWLVKSELDVYPFAQLVADGQTHWDGVRNYQARNMMRDEMKLGDLVLFYHSNTKPPHVGGIARVAREGYPDFTSWDSTSKYFDESSSPDAPRWFMVDLEPVIETPLVSLDELRSTPSLEGMALLQRGQRLSVQPVSIAHFEEVLRLAGIQRDELI